MKSKEQVQDIADKLRTTLKNLIVCKCGCEDDDYYLTVERYHQVCDILNTEPEHIPLRRA